MMAGIAETKGLILFSRDYKEKDKLVKLFTESSGKVMCFVKGAHRRNNPLLPAIQPFTEAVYIGDFRTAGLSFLNSAKEIHVFRKLQEDIFLNAYGTYLLNLADAAIDDQVYDPNLYSFLRQALQLIDQGMDAEIITNIFEVQVMQRFGVSLNWQQCAVCGQTQGAFDFSSNYHGVLCQKHWELDPRRYHADPKAIHFLRLFAAVSYDRIDTIALKPETKQALRQTLDQLYEEYIGVRLKSKKFIDQMTEWSGLLKPATD